MTSSRRPPAAGRRRFASLLAVVGIAAAAGALAPRVDAATPATPLVGSTVVPGRADTTGAGNDDNSSVTETHTWQDDQGDSRSGTVTVSQTKDLGTRQIVDISWSGFFPTVNSTGAGSVHEAPQAAIASGYPVVLMECQGDDPKTMTPEDCAFPNPNRFLYYAIYDANETEAIHNSSMVDTRPFIETSGKVDKAKTGEYVPLPSDYDDSNVLGTTWYATWTDPDGTHKDARFEVRSMQEAPQSLGCGDAKNRSKGACSIVVVPIRPMPCINDYSCPPPSSDRGLSADFKEWQSASNWRNKFVFPVSFRPFPSVCQINGGVPTPTQGSEMLDQAMLSWLPKFCTTKSLFKLGFTRLNDDAARRNLFFKIAGQYSSDLAFTTLPAKPVAGRPIVDAPVAVTGFAVAFTIDSTGYEQIAHINLDARLLAKLVTESYDAPPDPNVQDNPDSLLQDPEFLALNPGIKDLLVPAVQIDNPVLVQGSPDMVWEVTRYIDSDPQARAWLNGKPDPWGMKVNPHYQGKQWPLPNSQFQLRDPWTWKDDPRQCTPKPVMEQVGQFVFDTASVSDAMANRQPQDYSVCAVGGQGGNDYEWAHSARQILGSRAMISIMDLPSAEEYQFPTAALRNAAGKYVEPTDASLAAALKIATKDPASGTVESNLTQRSPDAYPGMMAVYAATPTHGLSATEASNYSKMITYMATQGQVHGTAAGQLPLGYLSLPQDMRAQALADAKHVANQDCTGALPGDHPCQAPPPPTTPPPTTPGDGGNGGTGGTGGTGGSVPTGPVPTGPTSTGPTTPTSTTPTTAPVQPEVFTASQQSSLAAHLIPVLLVLALGGLVLIPIVLLQGRTGALLARLRRKP